MAKEIINRPTSLVAPELDYFLVDGSASMRDKWWDTLGAMDNWLKVLRDQNVASHGIVHVFDSYNIESVQRDSAIGTWPTFGDDPIGSTFGGTPLYDAINTMGRRLRDLDPKKASIVIATDGDDTGNEYTDEHQARAILDWCRAKGWQVTFIGCDFNNSKQAKLLGADESNSIGVARKMLGAAGEELGRKRARFSKGAEDMKFSDAEKKQFGGYLTGPSGGK